MLGFFFFPNGAKFSGLIKALFAIIVRKSSGVIFNDFRTLSDYLGRRNNFHLACTYKFIGIIYYFCLRTIKILRLHQSRVARSFIKYRSR